MATAHTDPAVPGLPSGPDSHLSDRDLINQLSTQLLTAQQGPHAPSGWARALGDTGLDFGGGSPGGGYRFTSGELDAVISQWQGILQRVLAYDRHIHVLTDVTTAAADEASAGFTQQARTLGVALQDSHQSLQEYVASYIGKLQAAKRNYQNAEETATSLLHRQVSGGRS